MAFKNRGFRVERGTTIVEFTITLLVYLAFIFAIIEFALVIFDATRLSEGTRVGARYAIVNDPACDIYNGGCETILDPTSDTPSYCDGKTGITLDSCDLSDTSSGCNMVKEMDKLMIRYSDDAETYAKRSILAGSGKVYVCFETTDVGDPGIFTGGRELLKVTVEADDVQHPLLVWGLLGLNVSSITLPHFATTRTAEDLYSN